MGELVRHLCCICRNRAAWPPKKACQRCIEKLIGEIRDMPEAQMCPHGRNVTTGTCVDCQAQHGGGA